MFINGLENGGCGAIGSGEGWSVGTLEGIERLVDDCLCEEATVNIHKDYGNEIKEDKFEGERLAQRGMETHQFL